MRNLLLSVRKYAYVIEKIRCAGLRLRRFASSHNRHRDHRGGT